MGDFGPREGQRSCLCGFGWGENWVGQVVHSPRRDRQDESDAKREEESILTQEENPELTQVCQLAKWVYGIFKALTGLGVSDESFVSLCSLV